MSVWVDTLFRRYPGVATGDINPASIDFHTDLNARCDLAPGKSVLLSTVETVDLSDLTVAGLLVFKTSSFRRGLALASPGWVDPGYTGTLTFRVTNVSDGIVTINPYDKLVQMIVIQLDEKPSTPYNGRYQGSNGAVGFREAR